MAVGKSSDGRRVFGTVTSMSTGDPVGGLRVIAMDKDVLFDDLLGQAITDENGRYQIHYGVEDFRDVFERAPDIYLIVVDEDRVIGDTRQTLVRQAPLDREMNVQVPERPNPLGPTPD